MNPIRNPVAVAASLFAGAFVWLTAAAERVDVSPIQVPQLGEFSDFVLAVTPRLRGDAADGDPLVVTNPAPKIEIRREGDHIAVDFEPCCIELSFDGGVVFLRLACFYQSGTMTVNRNRPSVIVRAMPLGSPWPEPPTNAVAKIGPR